MALSTLRKAAPKVENGAMNGHAPDPILGEILNGGTDTPDAKRRVIERARQQLRDITDEATQGVYLVEIARRLEMPLLEVQRLVLKTDIGEESAAIVKRVKKQLADGTVTAVAVPMHTLPKSVAEIFEAWHQAYLLPRDYFLTAGLVAAGAVTGSRFCLEYKFGQRAYGSFYAALVGNSGLGKSPAMDFCFAPIYRIEEDLQGHNAQKTAAWKQECFEQSQNGGAAKNAPPPPTLRDFYLDNATLEKTLKILADNPAGVVLVKDELAGLFAAFGRYSGGGGEEEYYLSIYDQKAFKVSRSGNSTVFCKKPFLCLAGGIQPGRLLAMSAGGKLDNGLFARFIFGWPEDQNKPYETDLEPDGSTFTRWDDIIRRIWKLPTRHSVGNTWQADQNTTDPDTLGVEPIVFQLSREARTLYKTFLRSNTDSINRADEDNERSLLVKFESRTLRFALVLHLLDIACDPHYTAEIEPEQLEKMTVSEKTMARAIELTGYFAATSLRALNRVSTPIDSMKPTEKALYEALSVEFETKTFLKAAGELGIPERTAKRLLADRTFFVSRGRGVYEKRF